MNTSKGVYNFGQGKADGSSGMNELLGGKGANLAEMSGLGIPVPPGFTLTTQCCLDYLNSGKTLPQGMKEEVHQAIQLLEQRMGSRFGDSDNPLLVSVRSGAKFSMPGMMDTVLNLGLNDQAVQGLAQATNNSRFAYDSYRRLIQMYADVVIGVSDHLFEKELSQARKAASVDTDSALSAEQLAALVDTFKKIILRETGVDFPQNPEMQLFGAIEAVFSSWNNKRAIAYRKANNIPDHLGTAVTVQSMVFGNMGDDCGTGVAFTRDPSTGEAHFFGEWLQNAQGEDVVAGIRTPQPINAASSQIETGHTLEKAMPAVYDRLVELYQALEKHYRDMQDLEFTIQQNKLWILQTRTGKRTPAAEIKIAVDMVREGLITKEEGICRVQPDNFEKLLHPGIDPNAETTLISRGLGASPGAGTGRVVFTADDAVEWADRGEAVVLVREETSPEDIHGMITAEGILTARGGMTSHAAVVARGMSKPCVAGCFEISIDIVKKTFSAGEYTIKEGDIITIEGGEGLVLLGDVEKIKATFSSEMETIMSWSDEFRQLDVYANADNGPDCQISRDYGARGIGLCRTEHMFFESSRIQAVREMILATDLAGRQQALDKLLPVQRADFKEILKVMSGLPVIIRLLDPPLHEFLPHKSSDISAIADSLGMSSEEISKRVEMLREFNPMLGHRGCRLGITFPEIYEIQAQAILEATCELVNDGVTIYPKIMIPLISHASELETIRASVKRTAEEIKSRFGLSDVPYEIGTMIELPRACLTADELAEHADFFSFGTNDLTQTTFGLSRDDSNRFLPFYVETGLLPEDPFVSIDPGVGVLVELATQKGRAHRKDLSIGICGEHGGDPKTIAFCHKIGLDYVSCSPFRVPVARLAAAHAALKETS